MLEGWKKELKNGKIKDTHRKPQATIWVSKKLGKCYKALPLYHEIVQFFSRVPRASNLSITPRFHAGSVKI